MTALFLSLLLSTGSYAATELAKINDKIITVEEFNNRFKENMKFFRFKAPTKKSVLEDMIKRDLGVLEAKKMGLDKDPEVQDRIETVLYHSLLDKKLSTKFDAIQVDNGEIESYYKQNPEIRTSHIFVQVRFDATDAQEKVAREKIEKIKKQLDTALQGGKQTFAEVARTYSEGVAAAAGGDIDYQGKDKLDPVYYQTALGLKKLGAVSGIVRSQFGFHIIKLTGIKEFKDADRGLYKRLVFDEKRSKIFDAYMEDLKKKANVSVHYDLIKE